jgi:tetratricopeptide (TPR) repeat protein
MNNDHIVDNAETKSVGSGWRAIQKWRAFSERRAIRKWRIIIVIIGVVVIALLLLPVIQSQRNIVENSASGLLSEDQNAAIAATVQANPDSAEAQFELGNAYYEAGNWAQAIIAYQRAVELDPGYQAAYANLGVAYYQQQQFDLAASQYQKALELNPKDGEVAYNLGALYLQQALSAGEQPNPDLINRAIAQLEDALEISPDLAEPHFTLGVAYFFLDQKAEAIQQFETFLSLTPAENSQARQEAERYLGSLRSQ